MQRSKKIIFGVDEVGRGPLAGPVIAAAITGPKFSIFNFQFKNFQNRDSKKLSPMQRETIYKFLKKDPSVQWGIGRVGERTIDKINVFQATKLAMEKAVLSLEKKISKKANLLLLDGNFEISLNRPQKPIIRGDETEFLISLASIVAKVERDKLMQRLHKKYPQYGFDKHKGYGTKMHMATLAQLGPCEIHRASFSPINKM